MGKKAFVWLILDTAIAALAAFAAVLANFLIWQEGKDINRIIELNFFNVLALLAFTMLASMTASQFGIKFNYIVARASRSIFILFVLFNLGNLTNNLVILGILIGMTNAYVFSSKSLIDRLVVPSEGMVHYASLRIIIWSLVSIALPFTVAAAISSPDIRTILIVTVGIITLMSFLVLFIKIKKQLFNLPALIFNSVRDFEMRRLSMLFFGIGMSRAFTIGIMDVLILSQLGSIDNWSYVAVGLALATILAGVLVRKRSYANNSYTRALLALCFMAYAVSALFVLVEFNLLVFIIFTLMATLFEVVSNTVLEGFIQSVESDNDKFAESLTSYQAHGDIFRALGMLLPIGVLFILPRGTVTKEILIIMLSLITLVPFMFSFALRTAPKNPFSLVEGS